VSAALTMCKYKLRINQFYIEKYQHDSATDD